MGEARMMYFLVLLLAAACASGDSCHGVGPAAKAQHQKGLLQQVLPCWRLRSPVAHCLQLHGRCLVHFCRPAVSLPLHIFQGRARGRPPTLQSRTVMVVPRKTLTLTTASSIQSGSMLDSLDYPRRACGQNPITKTECIDDPMNLFDDRVYLSGHPGRTVFGVVANTQALSHRCNGPCAPAQVCGRSAVPTQCQPTRPSTVKTALRLRRSRGVSSVGLSRSPAHPGRVQ